MKLSGHGHEIMRSGTTVRGRRKKSPHVAIKTADGRLRVDLLEVKRRLELGTLSKRHRSIFRELFGCDPEGLCSK